MLELYKNIKKRRLELHLSQQQLAEMTGYASKSMIAHIESGNVDLSLSKIELFAKVLGVDPGALLGPTHHEDAAPIFSNLSRSEMRIVSKLRKLDAADRLRVEERIDTFLESSKYDLKEEEQTG